MRYIEKGKAPRGFETWKAATPDATYGGLRSPEKDDVRRGLCSEQHHLCAYCQQRIAPNGERMRVEHWLPQSEDPGRALEWNNLLAVCPGRAEVPAERMRGGGPPRPAQGRRNDHCDRSRGNRSLHVDPTSGPQVDDLFRYPASGAIESDDDGATNDIRTLNLGHWLLTQNRRQVVERLRQGLGVKKT